MKKENSKLDGILKKYEKNYIVQKASDIVVEEKVLTGVFGMDYVLDGGLSQNVGGHILELFGGESSGKTTFAKMIIAKYQKLNKTCVFVNAEQSYDPVWAEHWGVDNSKLMVVTPQTLEETGDLIVDLIGEVDLIVVDSITAIIPEEEIDSSLSDKAYAPQAKVNSPMCRKINKKRGTGKTTIIFINQLREKVGVRYGNPETTSGGRALKHLYDTRLYFKTRKPLKKGSGEKEETYGMEIQIFAKKNKKGKPYRKAVIDFYLEGRIDNKKCLFFGALMFGVIQLTGKTYSFKDKKIVGKDNFMDALSDKEWIDLEKAVWQRNK